MERSRPLDGYAAAAALGVIVLASLLVITTALPWLFMSDEMATSCTPMMGQMFEIMRGGMMR